MSRQSTLPFVPRKQLTQTHGVASDRTRAITSIVALLLVIAAIWMSGAAPLQLMRDVHWRLHSDYRRYVDTRNRVPCASLFPFRYAHHFTYHVDLPDYQAVRSLFDQRRVSDAHQLCNSGEVWLKYASGMFQLLNGPLEPVVTKTIAEAQRVVNELRDSFGVHSWPPDSAVLTKLDRRTRDMLTSCVHHFIFHFTDDSNRIEGSLLSLAETAAVLESVAAGMPYLLHVPPELAFNAHEAADHAKAWQWLNRTLIQTRVPLWRLTEQHITDLHSYVTTHTLETAGRYRQAAMVAQNAALIAPQAAEVPELMRKLVRWLASLETPMQDAVTRYSHHVDPMAAASDPYHPVSVAALLHLFFVQIHPFDDGNGRTARLLLNYALMSCGFPPVSIRSSKPEIDSYMQSLGRFSTAMDAHDFVRFVHSEWRTEIERLIDDTKRL